MKESTLEQREAIKYCEKWLYVKFEDDINNFDDCEFFLNLYLKEAKQSEQELSNAFADDIWTLN